LLPETVLFGDMQVYYIPNDLVMKPKLMFNLQDCGIASQCGYASTLAAGFGGNAFDKTSTTSITDMLCVVALKSEA
jgi:hypothetical protein